MAQLKPCPPKMLEKLKRAYENQPIQHFVIWDNTYHLHEEGSCKIMTYIKFRNLRRCDNYDSGRYVILASIGGPT